MSMSERLKTARLKLGLSTRAICRELGVSSGLWSQYEMGRKEPSSATLRALMRLGVNPAWLLDGRGEIFLEGADVQAQGPTKDISRLTQELLRLMASPLGRRITIWDAIMRLFVSHLNGLTYDEIRQQLPKQLTENELKNELELLQAENLVGFSRGRYRKVQLSLSHDVQGVELQALVIAKQLFEGHIPLAKLQPQNTKLIMSRLNVECGAGRVYAGKLIQLLRQWQADSKHEVTSASYDELCLNLSITVQTRHPDEVT